MSVNLSIKNAPDHIVAGLRRRADRRGAGRGPAPRAAKDNRVAEVAAEVVAEVRKLGLSGPSESAAMIRADRDSR